MKARREAEGELPPHPVTVLLAPTWGKSGILSRYGAEMMSQFLAAYRK